MHCGRLRLLKIYINPHNTLQDVKILSACHEQVQQMRNEESASGRGPLESKVGITS